MPFSDFCPRENQCPLLRRHLEILHYERIQILSIKDLLEDGRKPNLPPFVLPTYQQAQRVKQVDNRQEGMFE